jgi:hypothetical protein
MIGRYPEPLPELDDLRQQATIRADGAQRSWERARKWVLWPSLTVAIALIALAGCAHALNPAAPLGATLITAIVLAVPGTGWALWRLAQLSLAKSADPQHQYETARHGWEERAATWERGELARVADVPEWASAQPPSGHTDVFGGTLSGWEALLTVHGASILATRPLLVADLTGHGVAARLAGLARDAGAGVAKYLLPRDLGGLLTELPPQQFADALAEAIHAGTAGTARTDRAVDVRVLEQLAVTLSGGGITPVRLAAAVQAALGHPVQPGVLTAQETELVQGTLFSDSYRGQIGSSLVRLDAFLSDLARYATGGTIAPQPGYCTVLGTEPTAGSARAELTSALVVQWLTVQAGFAATDSPAIIVAGADQVPGHHLERLTDACDHAGVPVTLLFRHLRDDAAGIIGAGSTAFMRLGNHREAEQAASFIGRHHTFVLSSFTATYGGERSVTQGTSQTWGRSETRGSHTSRERGDGLFSPTSSRSRDYSRNWSYGTEESSTDGTNWNDSETRQRVYEYAVEPAVLQNLPGNALLLVTQTASTGMQAVECHPAIVTLPGVSMTPLPSGVSHPPEALEPGRHDFADLTTSADLAKPPTHRNWWESGDSWNPPR